MSDAPIQSGSSWTDVDGKSWSVDIQGDSIAWTMGDKTIALPKTQWRQDLLITRTGNRVIIRVETFDDLLSFMLTPEQAAPLLAHVSGQVPAPAPQVEPEIEPVPASRPKKGAQIDTTVTSQDAPWPKVSPLAIWALICSAMTAWPYLGLIPAVITVVLLWRHLRTVRIAPAWRHSWKLCRWAFGLLVFGMSTSVLAYLAAGNVPEVVAGAPTQSVKLSTTWGMILGGVIVLVFSFSIHEAAHAISAWWLGDDFPRACGRVTLNPISHIDPIGSIVLPVVMAVMQLPIFGFARPVEIRVQNLARFRRAHILISLAGPGSNLLVAAVSIGALLFAGSLVRILAPEATVTNFASFQLMAPVTAQGFPLAGAFAAFCTVARLVFVVNTFLAFFNLIPIPPLDGSWVLANLFPNSLGRLIDAMRPYSILVFLLAIYAQVFVVFLIPVAVFIGFNLHLLQLWTGFR